MFNDALYEKTREYEYEYYLICTYYTCTAEKEV